MAEAHADLESRHDLKLKLVQFGAAGRTAVLKSRLIEVERPEEASTAALASVQA